MQGVLIESSTIWTKTATWIKFSWACLIELDIKWKRTEVIQLQILYKISQILGAILPQPRREKVQPLSVAKISKNINSQE